MRKTENIHIRQDRVQFFLYKVAFSLEMAAAALVIILIVCQIIGLGIEMFCDPAKLTSSDQFTHFLELCLNIVVGIEFLKMLCRHNMDAVIEVLLFALARQLIITQHSMLEGLLCIVAIAILFVVRKFLFVPKIDKAQPSAQEEEAESRK